MWVWCRESGTAAPPAQRGLGDAAFVERPDKQGKWPMHSLRKRAESLFVITHTPTLRHDEGMQPARQEHTQS
jgi:hypothetical protein